VTRPGDELPARVEELFDTGCHLIERRRQLGELHGAVLGRAGGEVASGDRGRGAADTLQRPQDRAAQEDGGGERGRRAGGRDEQDGHVVLGVEHDDAGDEDRGERQRDGEEAEAGQLEAYRRQSAQGERQGEPHHEGSGRDDDGEDDHGENR
jgi:hypothetical protein